MFNILKVRKRQGSQSIQDLRGACVHKLYRGFPVLDQSRCKQECGLCVSACPSGAIRSRPLELDIGLCVFCGECARACPQAAVSFTNFHKTASEDRHHLVIKSGAGIDDYKEKAVKVSKAIKRLFGRSLKLRQVSAGGCNACEMELNACTNVNFNMQRFGIDFVASPRHADGIVITGPVTKNMASALQDTLAAMPEPRIIIAAGSCAISGGLFARSEEIDRSFFENRKVDLYVPGCPPHPLTFINGIMDLLGI